MKSRYRRDRRSAVIEKGRATEQFLPTFSPEIVWNAVSIMDRHRNLKKYKGEEQWYVTPAPAQEGQSAEPEQSSSEKATIESITTILHNESVLQLLEELQDPDDDEQIHAIASKIVDATDRVVSAEAMVDLLKGAVPLYRPSSPQEVYHPKIANTQGKENVVHFLRRRFEDYAEAKRGLVVLGRARFFIKNLFAEDVDSDILDQLDTISINYSEDYIAGSRQNPSNGHYGSGTVSLKSAMDTQHQYRPSLDQGVLDKQTMIDHYGQLTSRYAGELTIVVHELFHAIHHSIERSKKGQSQPIKRDEAMNTYALTLGRTIKEGFALLLEAVFIDRLKMAGNHLNVPQKYIEDLEASKKNTFSTLREYSKQVNSADPIEKRLAESGMDYTVGVMQITHRIYKKAGIKGLLQFIAKIDYAKLVATPRTPETLQQLMHDVDAEIASYGSEVQV